MSAAAPERPIVFVAGTGRSGTHAVGALIGAHPDYGFIPVEARFHCNRLGLADLLGGEAGLPEFVAKLRGYWWHRVRTDGLPRGLYNLLGEAGFEAALGRFEAAWPDDHEAAARVLFTDLLGPTAVRLGKPGLVEMSSHNLRAAPVLGRLFATARFVHSVRDGRDAADSVTAKTWGPNGLGRALDWWADRLRALDAGARGLDPQRLHVVVLDQLVALDREVELGRLAGFLGDLEPAAPMAEWFEREMDPERLHRGRWRHELRGGKLGRRRIERRYERILMALRREQNHVAELLLAAYEAGREAS